MGPTDESSAAGPRLLVAREASLCVNAATCAPIEAAHRGAPACPSCRSAVLSFNGSSPLAARSSRRQQCAADCVRPSSSRHLYDVRASGRPIARAHCPSSIMLAHCGGPPSQAAGPPQTLSIWPELLGRNLFGLANLEPSQLSSLKRALWS